MLSALKELARTSAADGHTVAFGEIGLDYDRLFMTPKDQQLKYFEAQLDVATDFQLPLFLHMRAAAEDFERLLKPRLAKLPKSGVVHSFTGSLEEMRSLVDLGLHIGVNGCSLKTEENLSVVKEIPLDRLHVETDGPWVMTQDLAVMNAHNDSAKFVRHMRLSNCSATPRNCQRQSRKRNGHRE
jgi:TatD DNase family protein